MLIVYHSETGHTEQMAEAVAKGARLVAGIDVNLKKVSAASADDVRRADAIILGSPAFNAAVAPEVQSFINTWPIDGSMRNKLGAAFVTGGGISAGEELVQVSLLHSMLVFGMLIVGGEHWTSAFGASAVTEEPPFRKETVANAFLAKGEALGARVAQLTARHRSSH